MIYHKFFIKALVKPIEIWDLDDMGELGEIDHRFSIENCDISCYQAYPQDKDYADEPIFEDSSLEWLKAKIDEHVLQSKEN